MKTTAKEILETINENKQMFDEYVPNFKIRLLHVLRTGIEVSGSEIRTHLHSLRTSGELLLLLAGSYGYKFAKNTQEVETYLKSLHKRALQIHQLFGAIKEQAEHDLGLQLDMQFYSELYHDKKSVKK